jgi:hypothetical protein
VGAPVILLVLVRPRVAIGPASPPS